MCRIYISFICLVLLSLSSYASESVSRNEVSSDSVSFVDRLAIHTNSIGWALLSPNVAVEYDLVQSEYKKISLLLSGRYNWNSTEKNASRYVYNILGLRAEGRWYFRTRKRLDWEKEMVSSADGWFTRMQMSSRFIKARKNPKLHRAYYVGPYVAYDDFSLKLGATGKQGTMIGAGVTVGYTAPLYLYDNGNSIDFEIGASVGVHYADYDKYGYNGEDKCYVYKGKKKGVVPYPMLSDVRLSLVYRFNPIKNQITTYDEQALDEEARIYRLCKLYEQANSPYVTSDTIFLLNREIVEENDFVAKVNRQILKCEEADSSMLLTELYPLYSYLQLPKNMLLKNDDVLLPNMEIDSVSQLGVQYLDGLVAKYSNMLKADGVETVESLIIKHYQSLREKFVINNDTVSGISYFDLLVKVVPGINEYCIKPHNEQCVLMPVETAVADSVSVRNYFLGINDNGQAESLSLNFVEYSKLFYLNDTIVQELNIVENERIKADNILKIRNAERMLGIVVEDKSRKK